MVETEAQTLAPVDTGEYREGIRKGPVTWSGQTVTGTVEATAPHSVYVEYGFGAMGAAGIWSGPFPYSEHLKGYAGFGTMRNALDLTHDAVISAIASKKLP